MPRRKKTESVTGTDIVAAVQQSLESPEVSEVAEVQASEEVSAEDMFQSLSREHLLELNFRHERIERLQQEKNAKSNAAAVIQLQMSAQVSKLKQESQEAERSRKAASEELVKFVKEMAPKYGFEYADFKEGRVSFDDETGRIFIID